MLSFHRTQWRESDASPVELEVSLRQALLKSIGRGIASSFLALQIFGAIGRLADDCCLFWGAASS